MKWIEVLVKRLWVMMNREEDTDEEEDNIPIEEQYFDAKLLTRERSIIPPR